MNDNNTPENETPSEAVKLLLNMENSAHNIIAKVVEVKKMIILATVAIVVLALLFAIVSQIQQKAENKAWNNIFVAEFNARQQGKADALDEQFKKIAPEIANSKARFYPQMLELAQYGVSDKKEDLQKAAAAAEKFLAEFPKSSFVNQVRLDYAAVLANLGDCAKAEAQYKEVMATGDRDEKYSARLFAALMQEQTGHNEEALDNYARLANERAELASVAAYARLRLEEKMKGGAAAAQAPAAATPAAQPAAQKTAAPIAAPAQPAVEKDASPASPAEKNAVPAAPVKE